MSNHPELAPSPVAAERIVGGGCILPGETAAPLPNSPQCIPERSRSTPKTSIASAVCNHHSAYEDFDILAEAVIRMGGEIMAPISFKNG